MHCTRNIRVAVVCAAVSLPCLIGASCGPSMMTGDDVVQLTPAEAQSLIQERQGDESFMIIDVRNPEEYAGGHIAGAVNVCYLCSTFNDAIGALDKAKTYLVYCGSDHRSPLAEAAMLQQGFTNLYNLTGGLAQWTNDGLPVVQ
jgi:phage shock protein E